MICPFSENSYRSNSVEIGYAVHLNVLLFENLEKLRLFVVLGDHDDHLGTGNDGVWWGRFWSA